MPSDPGKPPPRRRRGFTERFRKLMGAAPAPADDDDLMFLTHAPGSVSPDEIAKAKRQAEREAKQAAKENEAATRTKPRGGNRITAMFRRGRRAGKKVKQTRQKKRPPPDAGRDPGPGQDRGKRQRRRRPITMRLKAGMGSSARGVTQRFGKGMNRLGETAGWGALDRTLVAARQARLRRHREPPPERPPSFLLELPGAFLRPLHPSGLLTILFGVVVIAASLLLLRFVPPLGWVVSALAVALLAALRLKYVGEVAHGRDQVVWPELEEAFAGLTIYAGLLVLFVPAVVLAVLAWGPEPWRPSDPTTLPGRAKRLIDSEGQRRALARAAADVGEGYQGQAWKAHDLVREHRDQVGVKTGDAEELQRRELSRRSVARMRELAGPKPDEDPADVSDERPRELFQASLESALARIRTLTDLEGATPQGLAARGLLAAALLLFPIALLAGTKLQSAYASLYLPLLLRSIVMAPLAYAAVVAIFLAQDLLLLLALVVPQPALRALAGDAMLGDLLAVVVAATAILVLPLISGAALGRFYRCRRHRLGW